MLDLSSSDFARFGTSLSRFFNSKPHEQTEFADNLPFSAGSDLDLLETSSVLSSQGDDDDEVGDDDEMTIEVMMIIYLLHWMMKWAPPNLQTHQSH